MRGREALQLFRTEWSRRLVMEGGKRGGGADADLLLLDGLLSGRALQKHAALLRRLARARALCHRRPDVDRVRKQRLRHLAELLHLAERLANKRTQRHFLLTGQHSDTCSDVQCSD